MHPRLSATLALALLALAACGVQLPISGGGSSPPNPVPSAAPPTARPRPTKAPTATPTPPEALRAAIERTRALTTYRVSFAFSSEGAGDLIRFSGAFSGRDSSFQASGSALAGQGGGLEAVTVGGQTYARGPLPLPGASEAKWYSLGANPPPALQPTFAIGTLLDMLTGRLPLDDLTPDGEEALHGQTCARYRGGLAAALGALDGTGRPTTPEAAAAEATPVVERMQAQGFTFDKSEALAWVCPDGFLHQMRVAVHGAAKDKQPFSTALDFSVTDPNGTVEIAAPPDAVPPGPALGATVRNGGNVREQPNLKGTVLDQINAREKVALIGKTASGQWYRILNERGVTGWVSATLLTVDRATAAQVPVEK